MSTVGTPQYVGSPPLDISQGWKRQDNLGNKCTKVLCKYVLPASLIAGAGLIVLAIVKFLKNSPSKSPSPAPSPAPAPSSVPKAQPPPRPYPRNVPAYDPSNAAQPQPWAGANNSSRNAYSAYQQGNANAPLNKVLNNRYEKIQTHAYDDNKLPPYSNYADALGGQGQVQTWDEATFNKTVLQQKQPALVAFTATGCGWCEKLKPAFAEAARQAKITLAIVDRATAGGLNEKYGVQGFPTIILFRGGERAADYKGDRSPESLVRFTQDAEEGAARV